MVSEMKHSYYVSPSIDCYYMQKTEGKCLTFRKTAWSYFFLKDMQSVHWSTDGLHSWVPTVMQSRQQ